MTHRIPDEPNGLPKDSNGALDVTNAAKYLGVSVSFLNRLRSIGGSCPYSKLGTRVVYRQTDLDAWLDQHKRRSTADTGEVA